MAKLFDIIAGGLFHAAVLTSTFAPYDLVRQMRASFNVLVPLLARTGEAKVSLPGGCTIGAPPFYLHLQALTAIGAAIELAVHLRRGTDNLADRCCRSLRIGGDLADRVAAG